MGSLCGGCAQQSTVTTQPAHDSPEQEFRIFRSDKPSQEFEAGDPFLDRGVMLTEAPQVFAGSGSAHAQSEPEIEFPVKKPPLGKSTALPRPPIRRKEIRIASDMDSDAFSLGSEEHKSMSLGQQSTRSVSCGVKEYLGSVPLKDILLKSDRYWSEIVVYFSMKEILSSLCHICVYHYDFMKSAANKQVVKKVIEHDFIDLFRNSPCSLIVSHDLYNNEHTQIYPFIFHLYTDPSAIVQQVYHTQQKHRERSLELQADVPLMNDKGKDSFSESEQLIHMGSFSLMKAWIEKRYPEPKKRKISVQIFLGKITDLVRNEYYCIKLFKHLTNYCMRATDIRFGIDEIAFVSDKILVNDTSKASQVFVNYYHWVESLLKHRKKIPNISNPETMGELLSVLSECLFQYLITFYNHGNLTHKQLYHVTVTLNQNQNVIQSIVSSIHQEWGNHYHSNQSFFTDASYGLRERIIPFLKPCLMESSIGVYIRQLWENLFHGFLLVPLDASPLTS